MNLRAFCFATAVEAAAIKVIIKRKVVFFIFFLLFRPVYSREEGHFITQMGDVLVSESDRMKAKRRESN
jgi:hypothetical protein